MNKLICYINNNYIDIKKDNKIHHILLNSIKNDDIINAKSFINEIKKHNIFKNIINNNIDVYFNHKIQEKDIYYYKSIFEELNCININIYDTSYLLTSPTLINNEQYYIIYFNDNYIKLLPKYLPYFLNINNINKLKIISTNKINEISTTKYYYYNNSTNYFLR